MALFTQAEAGHRIAGRRDISEWPWHWVRLMLYCRNVKGIHERAGMDEDPKSALPPRWMWWYPDQVDQWFKERRENAQERAKQEQAGG